MADRLRVLQVSGSDQAGGAERVAWDLFSGLRERGHGSWLAVGTKRTSDPDVVEIEKPRGARFGRLARRLLDPWSAVEALRGIEDFRFPGSRRVAELARERPDVIHAHNLHGGYFDLRVLPELGKRFPVVLTLHDAWLLAGHCAHSFGCERWKQGCGECPDLAIYPAVRRDATARNWKRKQRIFSEARVRVATPCRWLMQKVEESILAPAVVEKRIIPYGVDRRVFSPGPRSREELGLPREGAILLFAANGIRKNVFKDWETMRAAVARLERRDVTFVALGEDAPDEKIGAATIRFVKPERDPARVARWYRAASIYVHASRADTFPNAVLESLSCGTPVVATAVGGIPEQVEDGKTGLLAPSGDAKALATAIERLLDDEPRRASMGAAASESARARFDLAREIDDYVAWYRAMRSDRAA